jgi:inosose dehydratase
MPLAYHHDTAAPIETEEELDLSMNHSGEGLRLLYHAGHMAFDGVTSCASSTSSISRISHIHTKDARMDVIDALDRSKESSWTQ